MRLFGWFRGPKQQTLLSVVPPVAQTPYWLHGDRFLAALQELKLPDVSWRVSVQTYTDGSRPWQIDIIKKEGFVCRVQFRYSHKFEDRGVEGAAISWDDAVIRIQPFNDFGTSRWPFVFWALLGFDQAVAKVKELAEKANGEKILLD